MCILKLILLIFSYLFQLTSQLTSQPTYSPIPSITIGKFNAISSLTSQINGWNQYTINFIKTLTNQPKIQAVISLINFDALASNQFSFNSTINSMNLSGLLISIKVIGNSYFRLLSLQYMAVSYSSGTPYLSTDCFLCSQLLTNNLQITFKKVDLISRDKNRFKVTSFISGIKMYNNYQKVKYVKVFSQMKPGNSFIHHTITKKGKTQIEWICLATIIMDVKQRPIFSTYSGNFVSGTAQVDITSPILNWSQVPQTFNHTDLMYFGISSLELISGTQNWKFTFYSERSINFKLNTQIVSFSGIVNYFFVGNHNCPDLSTPYFNYMDNLCYDLCPTELFKQDSPIKNCYSCHQNCQTCLGTSNNQCTTCRLSDIRTLSPNSQCLCNLGYVHVGSSVCQKCQNFIKYCVQCYFTNQCTTCDFGLVFDLISGQCICPNNDFFVAANFTCIPFPGCLSLARPSSSYICTDCNIQGHFGKYTDNLTCICQKFYELQNGKCTPKCGDGINLIENDFLNCDDGNLLKNDGCDQKCIIQSNFGCKNSLNSISICSPLANISLQYLYAQRLVYENSVIIVIKLNPFMKVFTDNDFDFKISTSIPNQQISANFDVKDSVLKIKTSYTETLEDQMHQISVSFDQHKISTSQNKVSIKIKGSNLKLTYDKNIYLRKPFQIFNITACVIILTIFFIFCMLQQKMAATQLLLSCQLVFFSIFTTGNNAGISGLSTLRYLIGYNQIQTFKINSNNFQINQILPINIFKDYLLNFNMMIGVQLLSLILMIPFKLHLSHLQSIKQKLLNYQILPSNSDQQLHPITITQVRKKLYEASITLKKYLNRFYYPISIICLLPSIFYFSVQNYSTNINNKFQINAAWNIYASILSLLMSLGFVIFLYQQSEKKKPIFTFFRKSIFYPFHLIFLYLVTVFIYSLTLSYDFSFYILFALQIFILMYRVINKPYPKWLSIQSIDSLLKHGITIICCTLLFVSKFMVQSCEIILFCIPTLFLLSSCLTLARYLSTILANKRKKSVQFDLLKHSQHQDGSQKDLKDKTDEQEEQSQENQSQIQDNQTIKLQNLKDKQQEENQKLKLPSQLTSNQQKNQDLSKIVGIQTLQEEQEDQLTRIKRKLRIDLRQRRGVINQNVVRSRNKKNI